jgi:acyl carrier protein
VTHDEIRAMLLKLLGNVAPDADLSRIDPGRNLRAQVDIDSMDFLNFIIAVDRDLRVAIPEADYGRLSSLEDLAGYVEQQHRSRAAPAGS